MTFQKQPFKEDLFRYCLGQTPRLKSRPQPLGHTTFATCRSNSIGSITAYSKFLLPTKGKSSIVVLDKADAHILSFTCSGRILNNEEDDEITLKVRGAPHRASYIGSSSHEKLGESLRPSNFKSSTVLLHHFPTRPSLKTF